MRPRSKWILCALLMAACWPFSAALIPSTVAADQRVVQIEPAALEEKAQDILVFVSDKDGRMSTTKGRLSDRTRILDEKRNPIDAEALEPESIWMVVLVYDLSSEGLPFIEEMRMIRDKQAE